jgi:3'(2'), 5'-bisphosphate nucleotidase
MVGHYYCYFPFIGLPVPRKAFFIQESLPFLLKTAREAGALILGYYKGGHTVDRKEDASPVTEADRAADRLIVAALKGLAPEIPVVSEEGEQAEVSGAETFWLVDPIDGTKSFIRGTGSFTVNIALVENHIPVLGVIYDPVQDALYWGSEAGAFRERAGKCAEPIHTRTAGSGPKTAYISHSHINKATEDYLAMVGVQERIPCTSSIKFCFLAEGKADLYPRFGPTMEWDTAAGHAILAAAGGSITTTDGEPFLYGKPGFLNENFVASGT